MITFAETQNPFFMQPTYYDTERITVQAAADLIHRSPRTAQRYLRRMRQALDLPPYTFISVRKFRTFYDI